jgi:hypothetical protein
MFGRKPNFFITPPDRLPSRVERSEIEPQSAGPASALGAAACDGELRKSHAPSEDRASIARHHQSFADERELLEHPLPFRS